MQKSTHTYIPPSSIIPAPEVQELILSEDVINSPNMPEVCDGDDGQVALRDAPRRRETADYGEGGKKEVNIPQ